MNEDAFTFRARRVSRFVSDAKINRASLEPDLFMIGILMQDKSAAVAVLRRLNVNIEALRTQLEQVIADASAPPGITPQEIPELDIRRAAAAEARDLNWNYIGTEHLLLAISKVGRSAAADALLAKGIDHPRLLIETLRLLGIGDTPGTATG